MTSAWIVQACVAVLLPSLPQGDGGASDPGAEVVRILSEWEVDPDGSEADLATRLIQVGPDAVAPLCHLLDLHASELPAEPIARALGQLGGVECIQTLKRLLDASEPATRAAAVDALAALGRPECIEPLCHAVDDPEPPVQERAALALAELGKKSPLLVTRTITRCLKSAKDPVAYADVLGSFENDFAHDLLRDMLEENRTQLAALEGLRRVADPQDAPEVQQLLEFSSSVDVRKSACLFLGTVKCRLAVPVLIRLLEDPDPGLAMNAHWALLQISELAIEPVPALWKVWWNHSLVEDAVVADDGAPDPSAPPVRRRPVRRRSSRGFGGSTSGTSWSDGGGGGSWPGARASAPNVVAGRVPEDASRVPWGWIGSLAAIVSVAPAASRRFRKRPPVQDDAAPAGSFGIPVPAEGDAQNLDRQLLMELGNAGLQPESLAAAGIRPRLVGPILKDASRWIASNVALLLELDQRYFAATKRRDELIRLVKTGLADATQTTDYHLAVSDFETTSGELAAAHSSLFVAAVAGVSTQERATLERIRTNGSAWKLPVQYLVAHRTDEEWSRLGAALLDERGVGGREIDPREGQFLAEVRADLAVMIAKLNLDTMLEEVKETWMRAAADASDAIRTARRSLAGKMDATVAAPEA